MAASVVGRGLSLVVVLFHLSCAQNSYTIPDVTIEVFNPRGFRASIPNAPGINLFVFQGNVNRRIQSSGVGALQGEVLREKDGRWIFEDPNAVLKVGDVINYYVFVSVRSVGYLRDNLSYTVKKFGPVLNTTTGPVECLPTVTKIRSGQACGGQVIFQEDFSIFRENIWRIEQYIPHTTHPEYPFVSYHRSQVSVNNGYLRIAPRPLESLDGFDNYTIALGPLDFRKSCTSRDPENCYHEVIGPNIVPPIASGRITSNNFAFTYGTINIRAKLPLGDWLYPEVLLEPASMDQYGSDKYASGVMKIASARGNQELRRRTERMGNRVLYGGPVMDVDCHAQLLHQKVSASELWSSTFHDYSLTWTPKYISLSVDGEQWARVEAGSKALHEQFPTNCKDLPRRLLSRGTKIAPFDNFFQIALGVAAGGITEFPDDSISYRGHIKPWENQQAKGMLYFWLDKQRWEETWNEPEMLIDRVEVPSLAVEPKVVYAGAIAAFVLAATIPSNRA